MIKAVCFNDKVAEWLIEANGMGLTREYANKLLRWLKETGGHYDLPADSRTLKKRSRNINVDHGESVYLGIEDLLRNINTGNSASEMLQLKIGLMVYQYTKVVKKYNYGQ